MSDMTQMLKGILDGCILSIISEKEVYGYELSEKLKKSGFLDISEGSIYPLLSRMQKEGLIVGVFKDSDQGSKRKYYTLTNEGNVFLEEFTSKWSMLEESVHNVLKRGDKHD